MFKAKASNLLCLQVERDKLSQQPRQREPLSRKESREIDVCKNLASLGQSANNAKVIGSKKNFDDRESCRQTERLLLTNEQ